MPLLDGVMESRLARLLHRHGIKEVWTVIQQPGDLVDISSISCSEVDITFILLASVLCAPAEKKNIPSYQYAPKAS